MKGIKTLLLPEVYDEVNTGGPYAIVKKLNDLCSDDFEFIEISGTLDRVQETKRNFILGIIAKIAYYIKFFHIILSLVKIYLKLKRYGICKFEKIICHDLFYSFIIIIFFPKIKLTNVYHGQGSIYNEMIDLLGQRQSKLLKILLEYIERKVYSGAYKIGFPSIGSKEALIRTHHQLELIINRRSDDVYILYNGISIEHNKIEHSQLLEANIIPEGINFVTVATLNEAKGVDRIPQFLGALKKIGISFSWTIVGRGVKRDSLVSNIKLNNIVDESHLFETSFPKSQILGLLSRTDFYILFHRFSIFDLATLEAMSLGNIPILSNIGGNKEVIIDDNGILLDDSELSSTVKFLDLLDKDLQKLKFKNRDVVEFHFSNDKFSQSYIDLDLQS